MLHLEFKPYGRHIEPVDDKIRSRWMSDYDAIVYGHGLWSCGYSGKVFGTCTDPIPERVDDFVEEFTKTQVCHNGSSTAVVVPYGCRSNNR